VPSKAAQPDEGEHRDDAERYRPGYELAAERLLEYISEENLRPGDRLPTEQGLAEILGTTRNVTREAVKVLAAIGRLSVRRGAGIFVASGGALLGEDELAHFQPTDMEHVLMLLDYRRLIESENAPRATCGKALSASTPAPTKPIVLFILFIVIAFVLYYPGKADSGSSSKPQFIISGRVFDCRSYQFTLAILDRVHLASIPFWDIFSHNEDIHFSRRWPSAVYCDGTSFVTFGT